MIPVASSELKEDYTDKLRELHERSGTDTSALSGNLRDLGITSEAAKGDPLLAFHPPDAKGGC